MHLAQSDLRSVRRDRVAIEFGILGPVAYVLATMPVSGSSGTSVEQPCERPHWGFVVDGDVTLIQGSSRTPLPPGHAFHVPTGQPAHRFEAGAGARIAGFEPVDASTDATDVSLKNQGFEIVMREPRPAVVPAAIESPAAPGVIDAEFHRMSSQILTRTRLGSTSGYTSEWCDVPHWGLVLAGGVAIEWESDVEVLATGDIFYCPPGPPGHRLQAANPVTILDFTPVSSLEDPGRVVAWRRPLVDLSRRPVAQGAGPSIAALG